MTTKDKIYYLSESILKNGTRKRKQGRGREGKTEEGRKKRNREIKEMRIQYGSVIKDLESLESPILNTRFATCSY